MRLDHKGVNSRKRLGTCMVMGCDSAAIYQNGKSRERGVVGGYCSEHRHHARQTISDKRIDDFVEFIDQREGQDRE